MKEIVNRRHFQQVGAISVIVKTSRTFVFQLYSSARVTIIYLLPFSGSMVRGGVWRGNGSLNGKIIQLSELAAVAKTQN